MAVVLVMAGALVPLVGAQAASCATVCPAGVATVNGGGVGSYYNDGHHEDVWMSLDAFDSATGQGVTGAVHITSVVGVNPATPWDLAVTTDNGNAGGFVTQVTWSAQPPPFGSGVTSTFTSVAGSPYATGTFVCPPGGPIVVPNVVGLSDCVGTISYDP